ncbi:MAG: hypothetical protein EOP42_07250 [Sphingobacteriaceae bacterium]|nr:MAG: hypothetical protein EOP42_07250 [Sphingobacteriaceae bacterium]
MRVLLENVDEKHIRLLNEMATILNFKLKEVHNAPVRKSDSQYAIEEEEKEMTLLAMQLSEKAIAETWDKEDDDYWNSYL